MEDKVYKVIARKWRPQKFADVVGQEHIVKTLQNELLQQRTAHAYLFVGPRGIGKTSIARIFAKALNCKKSPVKEPCCECASCVSITNGSSLDVIEIDGASNNSVDNIRKLRDEVNYSPVSSSFKIYIIDEVHMLSASAWNALLKTVEEPPSHVKFLFATTEAHKVIPTIVSRCQRFDLRRIPAKLIFENLKKIAAAEKVKISSGAMEAIARAADGGIRDAQSLLDQMISFFSSYENEISEEQILEIFGLTSFKETEKLLTSIFENDKPALISSLHSLAKQGKNLEKLFEDILSSLRSIQICKIVSDPDSILEDGEDAVREFKTMAEKTDFAKIQLLLENLTPAGRLLHDAINKQIFIETIMLKAMRMAHSAKVEDLIARLQELREAGELENLDKKLPPRSDSSGDSTRTQEPKTEESVPATLNTMNTKQAEDSNVRQVSEKKTEYKKNKSYTPESLWHALIADMDHMNNPLLKAYMQEGKPKSLADDILTVWYDEDNESLHVAKIRGDMKLLNNCLHRITGNKNWKLNIETGKGISSPMEESDPDKSSEEVKANVKDNKFIQTVLELFEAKVVEVRG